MIYFLIMGLHLTVIHLTKSRWPNEYDRTMTMTNLNNWTWPKLKLTNLMKLTNLNFTSGVLLTFMPDVLFSCRGAKWWASEAGQVSQPVQSCKPGLGDLSKPTAPAYFFGVKLMFVSVVNFGQNQKIMFLVVKIFRSNFSQFLVILIRSSELASSIFVMTLFIFSLENWLNIDEARIWHCHYFWKWSKWVVFSFVLV